MSSRQINCANEIPADQITFDSLQWRHGVFHPSSSGSGREKKYSCWRGVQTRLGEIEEKLWYQLAESIIRKAGEQALLDALIDWENSHNYTKDSVLEVRQKALQLHISRIFDNPRWVDYIPFNRKYRPGALTNARLVTVVNECCGKPGEATQEQVDHACNGKIACPLCGKWSRFSVLDLEQEVEQGMEMM